MNKVIEHWEILAGMVASVVAYFSGKKRKRLDEISTLQNIYNKLFEDMNEKYEQMKVEITNLRAEVKQSNEKISKLESENHKLRKELHQKTN